MKTNLIDQHLLHIYCHLFIKQRLTDYKNINIERNRIGCCY